MTTGRIKWFDQREGIGFIEAQEGGPDIFVHRKQIQTEGQPQLSEGQLVEFEIDKTRKGPRALSVKPIEGMA